MLAWLVGGAGRRQGVRPAPEGRVAAAHAGGRPPGHAGRTAEAIADPERTGDLNTIMAESGFYGMQTFDQHLIALYRDGVIELEDALGVASNPHDLQVALRSQGLVA
jgi:hypothetical protein